MPGRRITFPALGFLLAAVWLGCVPARPARLPGDKSLRSLPLYFYPSVVTAAPPKATVVFFGNDVGFWQAHQELATRLSNDGYTVIGFDVKNYLERLPDSLPLRNAIFLREMPSIIARSVHDLKDDGLPIILAGHSFGADVALMLGAADRVPGVIGVVALSPTARSHLTVTALDLANLSNPSEPGSFGAIDEIRRMPPSIRIALLRGSGDNRRSIDPGLVAAGRGRVDYRVIPFAGHSLKALTIAGPMIVNAVDRIIGEARHPH